MGKRHFQEPEGTWGPCVSLLLITLVSCTVVFLILSPVFRSSQASDTPANSTSAKTQINIKHVHEPKCCSGIEHEEFWGKAVKWGSNYKVKTSEECCKACKSMCTDDGPCLCNAWVFCGDKKLCGDRFGQVILHLLLLLGLSLPYPKPFFPLWICRLHPYLQFYSVVLLHVQLKWSHHRLIL